MAHSDRIDPTPDSPPLPSPELDAALAQSRLFGGLGDAARRALAQALALRDLDPGTHLVEQGEPARFLGLVVAGELASHWRDTEDGIEYDGPTLSVGDDLGFEAVFGAKAHGQTIAARTAARVATFAAAALEALAAAHAEVRHAVQAALADRLYAAVAHPRAAVVDLTRVRTDEQVWALMPRALIRKYRALPIALHGAVLVVGFVDPGDLAALDDVRRVVQGFRVRPVQLDATSFARFYRTRVAPALDSWRPDDKDDVRWLAALKQKHYEIKIIDNGTEAVASLLDEDAMGVAAVWEPLR